MVERFDVVVSGISGRFPETDDINAFKRKLYNLESFVTVNNKRWKPGYEFNRGEFVIPDGTGKYTNLFDYDFRTFKMNILFGSSHDIVNRKVLEPSFEAIVDAGMNPYLLDCENIGVYMFAGTVDFEFKVYDNDPTHRMIIGSERSMQANKISYAFNLTGPSFTYLTDPFGSFQALKEAYEAISRGYISAALVGVASNIFDPKISLPFLRMGYLSTDGITRAFDKRANGYGRSESTVVLFLQRATEAKRSYGSIVLCDICNFGARPTTFIGHDENVLRDSFRVVYEKQNSLDVTSELAFVEMNASGIRAFDAMESNTMAEIICHRRKKPLLVGSIKSNVGHTEAAAPFMSLIKALFALDSGYIAPNAHLQNPNDEITALQNGQMKVINKITRLDGDLVAVNALSFIGTLNVTAIKRNSKAPDEEAVDDKLPRLILISGRTRDGLIKAIQQIEKLPLNLNFVTLMNDAFGSDMPSHLHRGYTILPDSIQPTHSVEKKGDRRRPIWFLFTGMGCQWNGCGKGLLDLPSFANVIDRCDTILKPLGLDIYHILTSNDESVFDNILNIFVAIVCVQIGLCEVLKTIGIEPDGLIGHSLGETACGYVDGALTLEQTVLAAYERGYVSLNVKTIDGTMAAIGKGFREIEHSLPKDVYVACHNARDNCTLSGPDDEINACVKQLEKDGVFAKTVNAGHIAYHSPHIWSMGALFSERLRKVIPAPKERSSKWISTSVPLCNWNEPSAKYCSAEYLSSNLLNVVLFEEGCRHIPDNAIVIEIAPHGLLQAIVKRSLPNTCTNVPLMLRSEKKGNLNCLLSAIGRLYVAGLEPRVNNLFPKIDFPVPRNTPSLAPYCTWLHEKFDSSKRILLPSPEKPHSLEKILIRLNRGSPFHFLRYHKFANTATIPASFFLYSTFLIFFAKRKEKFGATSLFLENVKFYENMKISISKPRAISVAIQKNGLFQVLLVKKRKSDNMRVIVSGKIGVLTDDDRMDHINETNFDFTTSMDGDEFYKVFNNLGYEISKDFVGVEKMYINENGNYGKILWNRNWVTFMDAAIKFQMFAKIVESTRPIYPAFIRRLAINFSRFENVQKGGSLTCHHDRKINQFLSDGIEIRGMECKFMPSYVGQNAPLEALKFFNYENPNCKSVDEFIYLSLQIATENLPRVSAKVEPNPWVYVMASDGVVDYLKNVQAILLKDDFLKLYVRFWKKGRNLPQDVTFLSIVDNDAVVSKSSNSFVLKITRSVDSFDQVEKDFVLITKQTFAENCCSLQKQIFGNNVVNKERIVDWIGNDLKVTEIVSREWWRYGGGKVCFLDDSNKEARMNVFSEKFNILRNLSNSMVRNGEWGSYKRVLDWKNEAFDNYKTIELPSVDLRAFSVDDHSLKRTYHKKMDNFTIEFSGIDKSKKKVMGLASVNPSNHLGKIDEYLVWDIPSGWSFEEAATVPYLYSLAYYIYDTSKNRGFSKSVFLNLGDEILLTWVCVKLFSYKKYSTFVAIPANQKSLQLREELQKMDDVFILKTEACLYEPELLDFTRGNGVDVVVNGVSGTEHLITSLNCLGRFTIIFDIHTSNHKSIEDIGMEPFTKFVSYHYILSGISYIAKLASDDKKELQMLVQEGIDSGLVTPLQKEMRSPSVKIQNQNENSVTKIITSNIQNWKKVNVGEKIWKFDDKHSYIIIGNSSNDLWYQLLIWLKTKGCSNFMVGLEMDLEGKEILFQESDQFTDDIVVTKVFLQDLDSVTDCERILIDTGSRAPVAAIFFVSCEQEMMTKRIKNVDLATQKLDLCVPLVSIFSGGLKELEYRRDKGLPACLLHNDDEKNFAYVLSALDDLSESYSLDVNPVLFNVLPTSAKTDAVTRRKQVPLRLGNYLPTDLGQLEYYEGQFDDRISFVEIPSLSPPYAETKGIYPFFVLPAVPQIQLRKFLQNLYYPVFCARFAQFDVNLTIDEIVELLFESLTGIQSFGPISLISETWNVGLATELCSRLRAAHREFRLFSLEGCPNDWTRHIRSFGRPYTSNFDDELLKNLFYLEWPAINFALSCAKTFDEKIKYCLRELGYQNLDFEVVRQSMNTIRYQICLASQYKENDQMLHNTILFSRKHFINDDIKISETCEIIIVNDIKYEQFLKNSHLKSVIHDKAAFNL